MKRLVLSLALIGAATSADAVTWYGYAFEQSRSSLHLRDWEGDGALDGRYTAIPYEGQGYENTLQFSFTLDDGLSIAGMTIDLANPGLDNFFAEGFLDPWPSPGGFVTFDASGMVSDWLLYDDMGEFGIGLAYEHSSAAIPIDLGSYQWPDTVNAADYAGAVHYGVQYSEPDDIWFKMTPGRWRMTISQEMEPLHAPVPASLPLLLGGIGGLAWLGRRRLRAG